MRILELFRDGGATLRLAMILAGGIALWLVWIVRNELGSGAPAAALDWIQRLRATCPVDRPLEELNRLRRVGAI